jgi:endonuclease YncB( thermonuclease family)
MNRRLEQLMIAGFLLGLGWFALNKEPTEAGAKLGQDEPIALESSEPVKTWRVKAGSVHDGDTFRAVADLTNEEIRVRMACIDAPELKQAGGVESRDFLRKMLPDGKEVILAIAEEDRFGRMVAEVFVPTDKPELEIAVNGEMVANGHAHFYEKYKSACPDNAEQLKNLAGLAESGRLGLWASNNVVKPWDFRRKNK